jgi:hypothetical protein
LIESLGYIGEWPARARRTVLRGPAWAYAFPVSVLLTALVIQTYASVNLARLFSDTDWYAAVLPALTSDAPMYDPAKVGVHPLQPPPFWNQAPSTALFASLLLLPGGTWLWGGLMAASVIGGLVLIWPRIGLAGTMILAPAILLWFPVFTALTKGNLNALIFGLLAVSIRFPHIAGLALGIGAAAKLSPILGVAWLVGRRDWRGAAMAIAIPLVATALVILWKGSDTLVDFLVLRAGEYKADPGGRIGLHLLGISPTVGLVLAAATASLAVWRASFTLAVAAMLMTAPVMHSHFWTWALVPLLAIGIPRLLDWLGATFSPAAATQAGRSSGSP